MLLGHLEVTTNVGQDSEILRRHRGELHVACAKGSAAREKVQSLGVVQFTELPTNHRLYIDRVTGRRVVVPQLSEGERGIETVTRGVRVSVDMVRAGNPAEHVRHAGGIVGTPHTTERLLIERAGGIAAAGALLVLSTRDQCVKIRVRGRGDFRAPIVSVCVAYPRGME